jgi:threonine dehydrogenase-like Zn-dependent dehydrogenase
MRVEDVPDPVIQDPTDVVVRVLRACVRGSDPWAYRGESARQPGWPPPGPPGPGGGTGLDLSAMFDRNIALRGGVAPVRAYNPELLPDVLDGTIDPSPVFDLTVGLDGAPDGYRAMDERTALKVLVMP